MSLGKSDAKVTKFHFFYIQIKKQNQNFSRESQNPTFHL